jgi:hypothetical protein
MASENGSGILPCLRSGTVFLEKGRELQLPVLLNGDFEKKSGLEIFG